MDWNEDGKKDLLIGDSLGELSIYLNIGTDAQPVLAAEQSIKIAGEDFCTELLQKTFGDSIVYYDCRIKPDVVDWNNDGMKDIITGVEGGWVMLMLNTGANNAPKFDKITLVQDGDQPLRPDTRLMRVSPKVYDWDKDGKKDLLLSDEFGEVHFYRNIGKDAAPIFNGHVLLEAQGVPPVARDSNQLRADFDGDGTADHVSINNFGEISIYLKKVPKKLSIKGKLFKSEQSNLNLGAADWNNDQKIDLLIGQPDGSIWLLLNPGLKDEAAFPAYTVLKDGNRPLNGGPGFVPKVLDFNGDGKKDLHCTGQKGDILVFLNQGSDARPVFNGSKKVEVQSSPIYVGARTRIDIADWNNDGHDDLIIGSDFGKGMFVYLARPLVKGER